MNDLKISAAALAESTPLPAKPSANNPQKVREAAQQFEGLLLNQILQSASQDGGWLGSGEDSASSCANGFAQEQLAVMMSKQGGFGLAKLISEGLERGR